jgi:protein SCO1/2
MKLEVRCYLDRGLPRLLAALLLAVMLWSPASSASDVPASPSQPSLVSAASVGRSQPSMAAAAVGLLPIALDQVPGDSIYRLSFALTDQDGKKFQLADRRGRWQLVSMFYTSCPYVCPLVIDTLKKTQHELTPEESTRLQVLLVSFDPARDTAKRLKEVYEERKIDPQTWTLARTEGTGVRKLAATLGVQYRELANREINHSVALVLLDVDGRIMAKTDKYGVVDPDFVAALHKALAAP